MRQRLTLGRLRHSLRPTKAPTVEVGFHSVRVPHTAGQRNYSRAVPTVGVEYPAPVKRR